MGLFRRRGMKMSWGVGPVPRWCRPEWAVRCCLPHPCSVICTVPTQLWDPDTRLLGSLRGTHWPSNPLWANGWSCFSHGNNSFILKAAILGSLWTHGWGWSILFRDRRWHHHTCVGNRAPSASWLNDTNVLGEPGSSVPDECLHCCIF